MRWPWRKREQGTSMLEAVMVLPSLLLIMSATIEFGIAFGRYQIISHSARIGVREAALFHCCLSVVADFLSSLDFFSDRRRSRPLVCLPVALCRITSIAVWASMFVLFGVFCITHQFTSTTDLGDASCY